MLSINEGARMLRTFILLTVIALMGCAPPKNIKPERVAQIRKIGLITAIPKDELLVLDHTGTMNKSYTYGQFGALGALVESAILMGIKEDRASKSIDGDIDKIRPFIARSSLKPNIDSGIAERLSHKYVTVIIYDEAMSLQNITGCLEESRKTGIDTLVSLEITYGLAAYKDKLASVSLDGEMTVYDVASGEIILKKKIESDQEFREHRTIEELSKEDGKLLKEDFSGAVKGFSSYVGRQLEVWQ
jgi:hypothetical protein